MERACEEHKLALTFNDDNYSSLVLSEVVIEHLLSAWRSTYISSFPEQP